MRRTLPLALCAALCASTLQAAPFDELAYYKYLHENPELSFQEEQTAATPAGTLTGAGFTVTEGVGGHGLVAMLENGEGPVLMLRADMDGLPVKEDTGLPYASTARATEMNGQEVSVMHACGHDVHMTVVTAAALELMERRDEWQGTLMVIMQPAEERGAGARDMLADGLFERFPQPDYNLSVHTIATLPAGQIGYISGWMMANVDSVDITLHGVGGHGAYPHTAKDPVVLAAAVIMDLQTLVSRSIHPAEPGVVTVGSIHAGTKHNIISDKAILELTVRSYSDEVRETLLSGIERIAVKQAEALGFPEDKKPEVVVKDEYTPALWNDPALVSRGVAAMRAELGDGVLKEIPKEMGGEDFSRYGRTDAKIPSFMIRVGTVPQPLWDKARRGEARLPSLHSAFFAPDPAPTLETGRRAITAMALDLLAAP
ncbi:amidohydrolase [Congregibacter litoralis]|uniref:Amidohydrolase n=1 Tax=Congregibacter litoralis KT71 TaxID=314285 RepID=A4AA81_9GAMM|nr:amidohydrolase [Congregibacter litoralis]EAQ96958.1 amidohydrolase [Congregibacter litoralis KT71]